MPKTDLKKLAEDAFHLEGWNTLCQQAKSIPKSIGGWQTILPSKTGKPIRVKYPRMELLLKPKNGRLDATAYPNKQDMDKIQKRLSPEEFLKFRNHIGDIYHGAAMAIEAISEITCQATGKTGAKIFREAGEGWIRTLHPSVIRKLKLKEKPLHTHI